MQFPYALYTNSFSLFAFGWVPGICVFLVFFYFIVTLFLAETIQYRGFDTFYGTKRQYYTGPAFEDILSINDHQTLTLIFRGIKHIARRAYPGQNFNNLHPALFAIRTLIYIELG